MPITAAGVGSGLDIENIVSQLMSIERQPLYALQRKESQVQAQISAYGALKSSISSFQDAMQALGSADKFKVFTANSSDDTVMAATADVNAATGSYEIVVQRIAQHHKLGSAAFADTATFGGNVGDSLTLTVDGASSTIDLSTASTLADIRDAINNAADNPGVTATLINVGGGNQHLVLSANDSGYAKRVQLSYGGSLSASTFGFSTLNQDASGATLTDLTQLDAAFTVDGYAVISASNKVTGVVDGLTFELKGTGSATLDVGRDTATILSSAKSFVDAYNAVVKKVEELKAGALGNDSGLRRILSQFRSVVNTPVTGLNGGNASLTELGIRTNAKTGELELDETVFQAALDADFDNVAAIFTDTTNGYAVRFDAVATGLLDAGNGLLKLRVGSLNDQIDTLQARQSNYEWRLQLREKALRSQLASLDALVGSLRSTGDFLAARLNPPTR
ncbi:flagellar filament capping protein FliD [endosymbiont of unidentified scaly snail isolate Monju]|uniref:flagellar filament capping protein FliD n=1 Tax=endosymbiont of unidentified scaly snail isolate Monju TaxID=1248727 RepID=UPI000389283D|nr:flagellar filament capping protein FliD [endosymbiont of unidentified scaly snail isolate Monju]BAN69724.1 flagellar hook-associated protein 2 [endosymbiont of unidentified scaly snail isolate Monju]